MSNEEKKSLKKHTSDLYALERHFMNAVKKQKSSDIVRDERAIELLHELDKTISNHVQVLEKYVERSGGSTLADLKSRVSSLTDSVSDLIESAKNDGLSKMMRDDYTTLSMIAIGYTMLHTHALADDDAELAELAKNHLTQCTPMITEISKLVPVTLAHELIDDHDRAEQIGKKALENTQAAWKSEVIKKDPQIV
jgi:ferritin-like metal-binding protein YciE